MLKRRGRGADGSALLLFPAGMLVMVVLSAIAFDLSVVWLRQQQARAVALGAANDAATAALDLAAWQTTGDYEIDDRAARALALRSVEASDIAAVVTGVDVRVDGPAVSVTLTLEVAYVFGAAVPGAPDGARLRVEASATAVAGLPRLCNSSHASCRIPG